MCYGSLDSEVESEIPLYKVSFERCVKTLNSNGLFQKISTHPLWTTPNWVLKNFRISKNNSNSFCRIPHLADSSSWGITELWNREFPVKIHKMLGTFMDFQSCSPSIFYKISSVVHGGCVDIFLNSPIDAPDRRFKKESLRH